MTQYEFALDVIRTLQSAGHQALLAGGCVRDRLRGENPKDYDVATSAAPQVVRQLFGSRRTLAIGESFGVVSILGPRGCQPIEVATFRQDVGYSDGRHPDRVEFSDARHDALRRDFTINGIFFDPVQDQVLDFVEGRRDLDERVIRAIGHPQERFAEDKLRMLRAIRFATVLEFELESTTAAAIRELASELTVVSGERIGMELRKILTHPQRARGAQLLVDCQLLHRLLPGAEREYHNRANWRTRIKWLERLGTLTSFEPAVVVLFSHSLKGDALPAIAERWRLTNSEVKCIGWIHQHWLTLTRAAHLPWSTIQPLLIHEFAPAALQVAAAALDPHHVGLEFCRSRLAWPAERLNPPPWLDGGDLQRLGLRPGPLFGRILQQLRDQQLDGVVTSRPQAEKVALELSSGSE